jgi:hypothetical protein
MIVASEVAIAMCTISAGGNPCAVKIIVTNGTSTMPPPTPSKPAEKPPYTPISNRIAISPQSIGAPASLF